MTRVRYVVAGLLGLTGVLHVIEPLRSGMTSAAVVTVVFGVAYLTIGFLVYRADRRGYYLGAIVPAIGLLTGLVLMPQNPTGWMALLGTIDVILVPCCIYLIIQGPRKLSAA